MNISINTDNQILYSFMNADLPKGVRIISGTPEESRGFDLNVTANIDITLAIDISEILAYSFASWVVSKGLIMKGRHYININSKKVSIDDPDAINMIAKEIDNKK